MRAGGIFKYTSFTHKRTISCAENWTIICDESEDRPREGQGYGTIIIG